MRKPAHTRTADLRRIGLLLTGAAMVLVGLGFAVDALVRDWRRSVEESAGVVAEAGPTSQYHEETSSRADSGSAHSRFTLNEFMNSDRKTRSAATRGDDAEPTGAVHGVWKATMGPENVVADLFHGGCPYAITGINVSLRSSDARVFGFGSLALSTLNCPTGISDVLAYATITGTTDLPYVKLVFRDSQSTREKFRFFGTVRPEGILGQIRSPDGRLLAEHVALTTQ